MRLLSAILGLAAVAYAQSPTPTVTSAQPNPVSAGGPSFTLTVSGSGFVSGAFVRWSSTTLTGTTLVDSNTITATVPANLIAISGKFPITVTNPGPVVSNSNYTVLVNPVLNSITPNIVNAGSGGFTVTASGQGFSSNSVLMLNAGGGRTALTTNYVSPSTLSGFIPSSALTGVYPVSVQVVDTATGASTDTLPVTLVKAQLTIVRPEYVRAGDPDFTLFAGGANFVQGAQMFWNGTPLVTRYLDSGTLSATVPAALYADPAGGQIGITVKNPGAAATASITIIVFPDPNGTVITSLDPPAAVTGAPSFTLTVNGSRFTPDSKVVWVTTPLPTTYVDSTKLTTVIPANLIATDGAAAITVATPGMTSSKIATLPIVSSQPAITSLSPTSAVAGGPAFTLTVNGSGFIPASQVVGFAGATTTYVSFNQLTASVPASAIASTANFNVQVRNPNSGYVSQVTVFSAKSPTPAITRLTPQAAPAGGGDFTLTVTGTDFINNATVLWNNAPLPTTRVSATQLTAAVSAALIATAGTASVTVSNDGPVLSNALTFTITGAGPALSSVSPVSANAGGAAFTLTLTGAKFTATSAVLWNNTPLTTTFVSDTQLTARVPANLIANPGTASISVTDSGATSNALSFTIAVVLPGVTTAGIVNAASSTPAIAPGTLISIYGTNLANGNASADAIPLPATLAGASVTINGITAPLLFASPGQINAQVPYEVKAGAAKMIVSVNGQQSAPVDFTVAATGPGVFTIPPTNHVVAQNLPDFTLNGASAPAARGQYVTIYATGQGAVDHPVPTGAAATGNPLSLPLAAVEVRIGGKLAEIQFAGLAPNFVGLLQVNVKIPDVPAGEAALDVSIGGVKAATTVISVQ